MDLCLKKMMKHDMWPEGSKKAKKGKGTCARDKLSRAHIRALYDLITLIIDINVETFAGMCVSRVRKHIRRRSLQ